MRKMVICLGLMVMLTVLYISSAPPGKASAGVTPGIVAAHYAPWNGWKKTTLKLLERIKEETDLSLISSY